MRKLLLILFAALFAVTACACSGNKLSTTPDSPSTEEENKTKTEYVRVYYDLAADDATVKDSTPYSEEKKMYFSEVEKGCTEYSLLVANRSEFVLVGWKKNDGTKFVVGSPINEDIVLTANCVDKNDTPMV